MVYFTSESLKVHTVDGYNFLIVEPMGNLSLDAYKAALAQPEIDAAIKHAAATRVYLELNGIWTVGMDQQEWTVVDFGKRLQSHGVQKMAIGLAEHVYPTFGMMAGMYEKMAAIPTKYFPDLDQMVAWLR
jgi:hypothetical protein